MAPEAIAFPASVAGPVGVVAQDIMAAEAVVRALVAGGGSLIDTAAGYGTAENNVGLVSDETGLRARLFLATKFSSRDSHADAETEKR